MARGAQETKHLTFVAQLVIEKNVEKEAHTFNFEFAPIHAACMP